MKRSRSNKNLHLSRKKRSYKKIGGAVDTITHTIGHCGTLCRFSIRNNCLIIHNGTIKVVLYVNIENNIEIRQFPNMHTKKYTFHTECFINESTVTDLFSNLITIFEKGTYAGIQFIENIVKYVTEHSSEIYKGEILKNLLFKYQVINTLNTINTTCRRRRTR